MRKEPGEKNNFFQHQNNSFKRQNFKGKRDVLTKSRKIIRKQSAVGDLTQTLVLEERKKVQAG